MTILLDTGPLVAALDADDKDHVRCSELLQTASGPLLVPVTVMVEVCWLVEKYRGALAEAAFLGSIDSGELELIAVEPKDITRIAELVRLYKDLPLGAVDASVIAIAERLGLPAVATLDHRHFSVVRPLHVAALQLLP
ncbi:PIN domain-containing protein [Planotetraspora phitsanulokensis]|uniref:Ribonuclease VapC n=1 Tax=Planotetraspora phitsanulokensis TaxID=575192 RepID=A0A8J3U8I3_9ACTN|nr:PIN domain-containing protein [Planotetraspora phitsanulokensis]GII37964.1 pilus biogenesis protein [Planotetraspora phitsanulokensis]